jgi:uncharacterized protein (DUF302 family)
MKTNKIQSQSEADEPNRRAEDRLPSQMSEARPSLTDLERQKFHHELQVHRLELEMQNADLRRSRNDLESALGDCAERLQSDGKMNMSYYFSKVLNQNFDKTITRVIEELKTEGFGILTEIDVKETLKRKLEVNFPNYRILGACNPSFAYRALQAEPHVGVMLPCNVVIRELEDGKTEVAAVDPLASMQSIRNEELHTIAQEIQLKLKKVIENL